MPVTRCYICEENPHETRSLGESGFEEGAYCPICQSPVCRHHLTVVRWRWRNDTRTVDSTLICHECKRNYRHRDWDPVNREWIS